MHLTKHISNPRGLAVMVGLIFSMVAGFTFFMGPSGTAEAGEAGGAFTGPGKDNKIKNNFNMVENPLFTPGIGASGSGKLDFNPERGEFSLTVKAEGLLPLTQYRVTQTLRKGTSGGTIPDAFLLDVAVFSDANGEIKVTRKHVPLELLSLAPGNVGDNWRIDQQIRGPGGGGESGTVCVGECILVCGPTTRVHMDADGNLVEGLAP